MNVIWKRPDGFHGASPQDFLVVDVGNQSRLWLHKSDHKNFPFRISGGWKEAEASQQLNNLVNLLPKNSKDWVDHLLVKYNDSMADDAKVFLDDLKNWTSGLKNHLKGDTWEVDIMRNALNVLVEKLDESRESFLKRASH